VQFDFQATAVVRDTLEHFEAGLEMRYRFVKRRAISVSPAGSQAEFHRFLGIAAVCIVMGQFAQMILQTITVQRLKSGSDSFVQYLAPLDQDLIVSNVARVRVLEGVLDIAHGRLFVYELGKLKPIQRLLKHLIGLVDNLASEREPELFADHCQNL